MFSVKVPTSYNDAVLQLEFSIFSVASFGSSHVIHTQQCTHLEIFDSCLLPLEQSVKLEVRLLLVEEDDLGIDVLAGGVVEVAEEVADAGEGDVAAHDYELLVLGWRVPPAILAALGQQTRQLGHHGRKAAHPNCINCINCCTHEDVDTVLEM